MSRSLIDATVRAARGTVVLAMLVAGAATLLLVGERLIFERALDEAARQIRQATELDGRLRLLDEQLTLSAQMTAKSGSPEWARRYESFIEPMDDALAEAQAVAPPDAARRFRDATGVANDRLVAMEREAIALAVQGQLLGAQALLFSDQYEQAKQQLAEGTRQYIIDIDQAASAHKRAVMARGRLMLGVPTLLMIGASLLLWHRLNRTLGASSQRFREQDAHIRNLADNDVLTGLPNRRAFAGELERMLARAVRLEQALTLAIIDLDRFKPINDRFGHLAGDAVLTQVAERMRSVIRQGEFVARVGGDEFVCVLTHEAGDTDAPSRLAQRLQGVVARPVQVDDHNFTIGATIGYASFPRDSRIAEDLLRRADIALYRAKSEARGSICAFDETMDTELQRRAALERDLRHGLTAGEVVPFFQPLVDLRDDRVCGFEVLARWQHPTHGLLPPAEFLPVAEEANLIGELTMVILRAAACEAAQWPVPLPFAVNMAPEQMQDARLPGRVTAVLAEVGLAPDRLEIELTENALVSDFEATESVIAELKACGIRAVALDDFGTGYSSLGHLSRLPIDKIKIDRSFVRTLAERGGSEKIVSAILGLGRSLNLPVVAEGIETVEDALRLRALGCPYGQGYLYGRPMSASAVRALLAETTAAAPDTPASGTPASGTPASGMIRSRAG